MDSGSWSTDTVPSALRDDAVRAMLSQVHLPWSLHKRVHDQPSCRLRWQGIGGCTLIECQSTPLSGYRRQAEITGTDDEHVGLLLVLSGRERIRQGEASVALEPGDMVLWDSTEPLDFAFDRLLHKVTLLVPKERLRRTGLVDPVSGTHVLDGRTGLGALVGSHLTTMSRFGTGLAPGDGLLASDLLIDLLGRLLAPAKARDVAGDIVSRALAYVARHLDDPDLSPSRIGHALGVTPRYLHMAFADTGDTLSVHIRSQRLDRIRRDLADPHLSGVSITNIVLRWGFNDAAHASRAFRQRFGMAPSHYRLTHR
ncbi:MAG: helix-turn-helix domain-containing protein [Pseudomonadota bacterium]